MSSWHWSHLSYILILIHENQSLSRPEQRWHCWSDKIKTLTDLSCTIVTVFTLVTQVNISPKKFPTEVILDFKIYCGTILGKIGKFLGVSQKWSIFHKILFLWLIHSNLIKIPAKWGISTSVWSASLSGILAIELSLGWVLLGPLCLLFSQFAYYLHPAPGVQKLANKNGETCCKMRSLFGPCAEHLWKNAVPMKVLT